MSLILPAVLCIILLCLPHTTSSSASYVSFRRHDPLFTKTHRVVTSWFRRYIDAERERLRSIRRRLQVLDVARRSSLGVDPEEYLGLPMNAFLLIKRLAKDYIEVLQDAKDDTNSKLLLDMLPSGDRGNRLRFPTQKDLESAARDVLSVQRIAGLSAQEISEGIGLDVQLKMYRSALTARECFHLGVAAYSTNAIATAQEWMLQALAVARDNSMEVSRIKEHLAYLSHLDGDNDRAIDLMNQILDHDPYNLKAHLNVEYYTEASLKHDFPMAPPQQFLEFRKAQTYRFVCDRACTGSSKTYEGIVYREHVLRSPLTVIYRNVLTQWEINSLKDVREYETTGETEMIVNILEGMSLRLERMLGLVLRGSSVPWRTLTAFCDSGTWLSAGHHLRLKPLATLWVFVGSSATDNCGAIAELTDISCGTAMLR